MNGVDFLLDTDVFVECLRGRPEARQWLSDQIPLIPGIPYVVTLEVLIGARNKAEMDHLRKELSRFLTVLPQPDDGKLAIEFFVTHRLRSGVGITDCLIGAIARRLRVPLYTFNLKHMGILSGVDARLPYERPAKTPQDADTE